MSEFEALFYFHGSGLYIAGEALGTSKDFERHGGRVTITLPGPKHLRDFGDPPRFGSSARMSTDKDGCTTVTVEKFEVRVGVTPDPTQSLAGLVQRAFPVALASADLFLALARTLGGQYWLPPWHEAPEVATYGMLVHAGTYDEVDREARWLLPMLLYATSSAQAANTDRLNSILEKTEAGEEPKTDAMLLADARAALHAGRRDTAGAVLFAAMAAEVKIKRTLLGHAVQLLEVVLEDRRELPTAIGQLLGRPMKIAVGKSLGEDDPPLYKDVTEQLFPLRNHVVHRGSHPTVDEAKAALDIATRLSAWLETV